MSIGLHGPVHFPSISISIRVNQETPPKFSPFVWGHAKIVNKNIYEPAARSIYNPTRKAQEGDGLCGGVCKCLSIICSFNLTQ